MTSPLFFSLFFLQSMYLTQTYNDVYEMRKITIPRRYRTMLTKSTVSQFHLMLKLKDSFSLAAIKIVAYSINAMNMKNSETKAKTDIPVIELESGRMFCISLKRRVSKKCFVCYNKFIYSHRRIQHRLNKTSKICLSFMDIFF